MMNTGCLDRGNTAAALPAAAQRRRRRQRLWRLLPAVVLALSLALPALAIDLRSAARQAAAQYHGKVISAETVVKNGRKIHVIRVLTEDGKVKTVRIPADD